MLEDALTARVTEILEALRAATGEAWAPPVRVKVALQAKLRPKRCSVSECGYRLDGCDRLGLSLVLYFPTGLVLEVTEDDSRTLLRTRGG